MVCLSLPGPTFSCCARPPRIQVILAFFLCTFQEAFFPSGLLFVHPRLGSRLPQWHLFVVAFIRMQFGINEASLLRHDVIPMHNAYLPFPRTVGNQCINLFTADFLLTLWHPNFYVLPVVDSASVVPWERCVRACALPGQRQDARFYERYFDRTFHPRRVFGRCYPCVFARDGYGFPLHVTFEIYIYEHP